jgi:hypothetical protein
MPARWPRACWNRGTALLYWENIEGGHGGAADNGQRAQMQALEFTFLWQQLGGAEPRLNPQGHADTGSTTAARCRRPAPRWARTATHPGLVAAGGRVSPASAAGGLQPGHLPLVQRGPAGAVVEPRPAHGAAGGRIPRLAVAAQDLAPLLAHTRLRRCALTATLKPSCMPAPPHRAKARTAPGSCRPWCTPTPPGTTLARCTAWRPGSTGNGGRPVLREHRPHVFWRVDVCAPHRRVQDRIGRAGGRLPRTRRGADRLPAEHPTPGQPGRARSAACGLCGPRGTEPCCCSLPDWTYDESAWDCWIGPSKLPTTPSHHPAHNAPVTHPKELPLRSLQFYATAPYPCSYLPDRQARSQVATPSHLIQADTYSGLVANGFRRSGMFTYRPYCDGCRPACRCAFRWPASSPRAASAAAHPARHAQGPCAAPVFCARALPALPALPERPPQRRRHGPRQRGPVHPVPAAKPRQFAPGGIPRAAADGTPGCAEDGEHPGRAERRHLGRLHLLRTRAGTSYGTYSVLWQIEQTRLLNLPHVYLGYWIAKSPKMAYKQQFRPHELLVDGLWRWHARTRATARAMRQAQRLTQAANSRSCR